MKMVLPNLDGYLWMCVWLQLEASKLKKLSFKSRIWLCTLSCSIEDSCLPTIRPDDFWKLFIVITRWQLNKSFLKLAVLHWKLAYQSPCGLIESQLSYTLEEFGSVCLLLQRTVCFSEWWPLTKCKLIFDISFQHSFLCSFTWYVSFFSPW